MEMPTWILESVVLFVLVFPPFVGVFMVMVEAVPERSLFLFIHSQFFTVSQ